ncbi:MAG: NAD(P)-dependent glycerol-3-phosphate dehydrogenase [Clostridiales bacterium]|nr:NAD(P)-dependent glycerol-3-phosphate dehydrogenase [Clostridiales bacterium]
MNIAVIGSGAWGTALAVMLARNGKNVVLWSFLEEEHLNLTKDRQNKRFLPGVMFPENLSLSDDLSCVKDAGIVINAVPSFAVGDISKAYSDKLSPKTVIVNVSKGIDRESGRRLSEIIACNTGGKFDVAALSGPSHAEEVGRDIPTAIIAASKSKRAAGLVQDVFMNRSFRVYTTPDIVGVELGGALKNIIALAAGICDGMKLGDNTKAALMTRGLAEMARLGVALGGQSETFAGLAGIGDLIVTCTSMHSRNRRAGILIGEGATPEEAVKKVGAVVEGYYATQAGMLLAEKAKIEMPITAKVYEVLYKGKSPLEAIDELMLRDKKSESGESWMKHITW